MEIFFLLIPLAIFVLPLILAVVAMKKAADAERQARIHEERIDDLELALARLRDRPRPGTEPAVAAGPDPGARPEPERPPPEPQAPAAPAEAATLVTPAPAASPPVTPTPTTPAPPVISFTTDATAPSPAAPPPTRPHPPPRPTGPPEPPPPHLRIDWEQWLGVRGAAVVGGVLLVLAAFFFLRIAIEQGWFPPQVRVALGFLTGTACVAGSELLRRRGYPTTANAVAGAGVVILYAATWAGSVLFGLISLFPTAFGLMMLVTAACGVLAWRHRSRVIAVLGLVGGFATPLLLDTGRDDPLGLFGYILLLDTGLLWLARRRRWPSLVPLSLLGTFLYQVLWIFTGMEPERLLLGVAVVAVFALLFAIARGGRVPEAEAGEEGLLWRLTRVAGVLLPFLFALYFAVRADLGERLLPLVTLMVLLSAAAEWTGRGQGLPGLAAGTAAADLAVVLAWWASTGFDPARGWELTGTAAALALTFHLFAEAGHQGWLDRLPPPRISSGRGWAAPLAAGGFLLLLAAAPLLGLAGSALSRQVGAPSLWPWLAGWVVTAALLIRQEHLSKLPGAGVGAAAGLALGFAFFHFGYRGAPGMTPAPLFFALVLLAAAGFHALALTRRGGHTPEGRRLADAASAAFPLLLLVLLLGEAAAPDIAHLAPGLFLAVILLLAALTTLAAFRLLSGALYLVTAAVTALGHTLWSLGLTRPEAEAAAGTGLGLQLLTLALFVAGPFLGGRRFAAGRLAWWAAALAGPAWMAALHPPCEQALGSGTLALLPLGLGALVALRPGAGSLHLTAIAAAGAGYALWSLELSALDAAPGPLLGGLLVQLASVALLTAAPFLGRRLAADRRAWWAAALAGPLWFPVLRALFIERFGTGALGLLPVVLAGFALAAAVGAQRRLATSDPQRRRAVVWLAAVALGFVALAIPLQLDREWITIGWALQALAMIALWWRLDHPGLKWFGLALAAAAAVRLLVNPALLAYHPRSGFPVLNWLMYTYLVPAAAFFGCAILLGPREVARRRPREEGLYRAGRPAGAVGCAVAGVLVVFAWINLTIFDAFSTGASIDLTLSRLPARDLTLSLAWAVYALVLLGVGFGKNLAALRWTGLAFLCLTLVKLFLYDLGELAGLYRVGSFVGLAISLLLVSLAYQRFMRGREEGRREEEG